MAIAFSPNTVTAARTQTKRHASSWTGIGAAVSLAMMLPIFLMILNLVSQLMFERNGPHDGNWVRAVAVTGLLLAPATYLIFAALTWDLLTKHSTTAIRNKTAKTVALGALPWAALTALGYSVDSLAIKSVAMLSLLAAMAFAVWSNRR